MDVTFNLSDVRFNIYLQIYMKKLSISTPWKEVKENEYKRISSFRPLPEVTLESIDTDEVPDVDFVEVGEVQSLEEEQSSFESILESLNQQRVSELEDEPTTIIETEPQKPVSLFDGYDFDSMGDDVEESNVEEVPVAQEESAPKPKFSLDYLFKKPETDKIVSPEIEDTDDTDETEITKTDEPNDDDVDTSVFGDELSLSEEDEDEEPDYSSEDDETEEDVDDKNDSVDLSAFDDEDTELDEDEDDDYDYNSESDDDDESVDLSKFEEDDDEEDEDEEPDYSAEDEFEDEDDEEPKSSVNTIDWGDDGDELEDEEHDYSSEDEPVIVETSNSDLGYLPSVDEVTTEVFNVVSIANKVYEYQQPVKHHKPKATNISKPVVNHPKPKTTVKPPIYDTEPVDDLVTFTRKRVRVSELDLLKIYSKKELEQALREGKVLRKKGIIIFAHA